MIREIEVNTTATLPNNTEGMAMKHVINEDLIFHRHQRMKKLPEVVCEFTKDPALLHQYYVLRSSIMSRSLHFEVPVKEDDFDKRGEILVVRLNRQVVGGARLVIRHSLDEKPLWVERGGFDLVKALPELDLGNNGYCEISKMALLEEFQNTATTLQMYKALHERYIQKGAKYCFATSTYTGLRIHQRALGRLGYSYHVLHQLNVPDRNDDPGKRYLVMSDGKIEESQFDMIFQAEHAPSHKELVN